MTNTNNPWHWFVLEVNPEPWAVGPLSVGRRNGKMYPYIGQNSQLFNYKAAIKEELGTPDFGQIEGPIELRLFFWRRRSDYVTPQARTHRKHEADLTNLQKSTEDALQGILFKNDKDVNDIHSVMVEQGPDVIPKVIIGIRPGLTLPEATIELPDQIWEVIQDLEKPSNLGYWPNEPS